MWEREGACVVSDPYTDISSSTLTSRLGGTKQRPRRDVASGCCGQNELASDCVERSKNVLCGKRLSRSWKLMASVSVCDTATERVLDFYASRCEQLCTH